MGIVSIKRQWQEQQGRTLNLTDRFATGQTLLLINPAMGRLNLANSSVISTDDGALKSGIGGESLRFSTSGCVCPVVSSTFLDSTFFGVISVSTAVAWAATHYDRGGVNGPTFGSTGLKLHYVWDGSEWAYDPGLTFVAKELVAFAYAVTASTVSIALNGKFNKRTGLSNSARSFGSYALLGRWIGQDPIGGRVFNGDIYLAGIVAGAWGDDALLDFTRNPWQIFEPRRIFFSASAPVFPTLSAATYMPGSLTSTGFRPRVTAS